MNSNLIWLFVATAIPIAFLIFVLAVDNYYLRRRVKRLKAELDEAAQLYHATLLGFDPIECKEHHFPGDCPLCGAD